MISYSTFHSLTQVALKLTGVYWGLDSEGFGDRFLKVVCEQFYIQAHYCRNWFRFVVGPSENLDPVSYHIFLVNTEETCWIA